MSNKGTSWGWIIFWLIVFWPVGLVLLFKKMSVDKSAIMGGKTKTITTIAWILISFGVLALIGSVSDTSGESNASGYFLVFGFIIGGVLLLLKSIKTKKLAAKYRSYLNVVINQENRSIDNISAAMNLPYDVVMTDLQAMINNGYLRDAFIHQANREIVIKEYNHVVEAQTSKNSGTVEVTEAVRCPGCGANNVIKVGRITECEYCGTPIKG